METRRYYGVAYSEMSGQLQIKFRSPYALSMRPTGGQYFAALTNGNGNAACSRLYGWFHVLLAMASAVWGAFFSTLSLGSAWPSTTA